MVWCGPRWHEDQRRGRQPSDGLLTHLHGLTYSVEGIDACMVKDQRVFYQPALDGEITGGGDAEALTQIRGDTQYREQARA